MNFTGYLRVLLRRGHLGPQWACIDHGAWPADSSRLEDYEAFLRRHFGAAQVDVVPELRLRWREWFSDLTAEGRHNLALAAWRDYALHLRDCELSKSGTCPRAEDLFMRAVAESHYRDLAFNEPDPFPCEDPERADQRRHMDALAEEVLRRKDVQDLIRTHTHPRRQS